MSFRLARNPFQDVSYVYFLDKAKRFWTRYACQNDSGKERGATPQCRHSGDQRETGIRRRNAGRYVRR